MCVLYRSIDGGVASTSAQISGQSNLDLLDGRTPSERQCGHDHAWRADAALRAAVLDERMLETMPAAETLDREHRRRVDLHGGDEAGGHGRTVDEDGARAAFAFAAALFRAGGRAVLA